MRCSHEPECLSVARRFVFNWHNFLSGCSSWDLQHWNRWTTQSQKMGYNGIMVHAYGNNPMTGFSFMGVDKPVGYLSSTRVGRDWATMHVNGAEQDFRRAVVRTGQRTGDPDADRWQVADQRPDA